MKIIELYAENFKRIKAIKIVPESETVLITGKNEQGKTSALDAIWAVLSSKGVPEKPIREGEESAGIVLNLGEYIVKKMFTSKGAYLEVTNADGSAKFTSPQTLINKFLGDLSFDPLEFIRLKGKEQNEILKKLADLSLLPEEKEVFSQKIPDGADPFILLDLERKDAYEERTLVNRELKILAVQYNEMEKGEDGERIDVRQLLQEKDDLKEKIFDRREWERIGTDKEKESNEIQRECNELIANLPVEVSDEKIKEIEENIQILQQSLQILRKKKIEFELWKKDHSRIIAEMKSLQEDAKQILSDEPQKIEESAIEEIGQRIKSAELQNNLAEAFEKSQALFARGTAKKEEAGTLTAKIDRIEQIKKDVLARAKMPIAGLGFSEDGVTFKGIPISQCSSAEALKVGCAISMSLNPKLRVILIRDGSLLDENSMVVLQEMAKTNGFQVWVERIAEGAGVGFYIEDGELKS